MLDKAITGADLGTHHARPNDSQKTKMAPVETEAMQCSLFKERRLLFKERRLLTKERRLFRSGHGLHLLDLGEEAVEECAA